TTGRERHRCWPRTTGRGRDRQRKGAARSDEPVEEPVDEDEIGLAGRYWQRKGRGRGTHTVVIAGDLGTGVTVARASVKDAVEIGRSTARARAAACVDRGHA